MWNWMFTFPIELLVISYELSVSSQSIQILSIYPSILTDYKTNYVKEEVTTTATILAADSIGRDLIPNHIFQTWSHCGLGNRLYFFRDVQYNYIGLIDLSN